MTAEAQAAQTAEAQAAKTAAFGALQEAAEEAEAEAKARAKEEKTAEARAKWVGRLRRTNARYTPDSTLQPRQSRWGTGEDLFDNTAADAKSHHWRHRVGEVCEKLMQWPFARRVGFQNYSDKNFIRDAHRWNVGYQKLLTKQNALNTTHAILMADVPERFRSAIGDLVKEVNDMVNNHLGEVREIDGGWVWQEGEVPLNKVFYNPQYAVHMSQWWEWLQDQKKRKEQQPAIGGDDSECLRELPDPTRDREGRYTTTLAVGNGGGFKARQARVISLAELFWFFGTEYTARELYAYYVNARRLVLTKPHSPTNKERREMVVAHYATEGHWGLGSCDVGHYSYY